MRPATFNPRVVLEVVIPEPLFQCLQQVLATQPTQNIGDLAGKAIAAYLAHLNHN